MSLVNFYKGKSYDYNEDNHSNGIYQCTDTGDTYIFGVKNGNNNDKQVNVLYPIIIGAEEIPTQLIPILNIALNSIDSINAEDFNNAVNYLRSNNNFYSFSLISTDINSPGIYNIYSKENGLGSFYIQITSNIIYGYSFEEVIHNIIIQNDLSISHKTIRKYMEFGDDDKNSIGLSLIDDIEDKEVDIVFKTKGDGTKALMDNGGYKTITLGNVTSIQEVTTLPSNPDANTLYLIPEDSSGSDSGESPLG